MFTILTVKSWQKHRAKSPDQSEYDLLRLIARRACWFLAVLCLVGVFVETPVDESGTLTSAADTRSALWYGMGALVSVLLARAVAASGPPPAVPPVSIRSLVSPVGLSRLLFLPRDRYGFQDTQINMLGSYRTLIGVASLFLIGVYPAVERSDPGEAASQLAAVGVIPIVQALRSMVVAGLATITISLWLSTKVPESSRELARASLWRVTRTIGAAISAFMAMFVLSSILESFAPWLEAGTESDLVGSTGPVSPGELVEGARIVVYVLIGLAVLIPALWIMTFFYYSLFYVTKYQYRIAEGHPKLGPAAAVVTTWAVLALTTASPAILNGLGIFGEADLGLSVGVGQAMSLVGAITTTLLALWEVRRMTEAGLGDVHGQWR